MANNLEEVLVRLGIDASSLSAGMQKVVAEQRTAAEKIRDAAKAALDKEMADRTAAEDRKIDLARKTNDTLLKLQQERLAKEKAAQEAVNREIAAGSGGYGWMGRDAKGKPIRAGVAAELTGGMIGQSLATGGGLSGVAEAAEGGAGFAIGTAITAAAVKGTKKAISHGAMREIAVMVHEALSGNFRRMLGSFSVLLSRLGLDSIMMSVLRIFGPIAAFFGGWKLGGMLNQHFINGPEQESQANANATREEMAKRIQKFLEFAMSSGQMSKTEGGTLIAGLGSFAGLKRAQKALNGIDIDKQDFEEKKRQAEEIVRLDKETAAIREEIANKDESAQTRINRHFRERIEYSKYMATLDQKSVEYHAALLEQAKQDKQIEQDKLDLKEEQTRAQEKANEAARQQEEKNREASNLYRRIQQNLREMGQEEAQYNSIENIAGRNWMRRLERFYGPGGRGDLGRGNGPFAWMAQQYELAKYQQIWDRTYGNIDQANEDRQRMVNLRDAMVSAGVASPQMQMEKIQENTAAMETHLAEMIRGGAVINTRLTDDDD